MTHSITTGKVRIGRTIRPADFESKVAEVELSYSLPEGANLEQAEAALTAVSNSAIAKVHAILSITAPVIGTTPAASTAATPAPTKGKGSKGKAAEVAVVTAGPDDPKAQAAATAAAADVLGMDETAKLPDAALGLGDDLGLGLGGDDGLGDILGAAPTPVTDEELTSAITHKNAEIKNPQAIRALIGKYVQPPKQARDISAEVRHKFLEELGALKAA